MRELNGLALGELLKKGAFQIETVRPRQVYLGHRTRNYVSIEQRKSVETQTAGTLDHLVFL